MGEQALRVLEVAQDESVDSVVDQCRNASVVDVMTGRPQAIASATGRPKESSRLGLT